MGGDKMKLYKREHYTLATFENEMYKAEIYNETTKSEHTIYSDKWEELYKKAKDAAKNGNIVEIWEKKYEFLQ